jgi:septal ring factor EnvC (AmiA/AmiB activator)
MKREGYWDYMGRKMREDRIKKEVISQEDMWKKEIAEMQKTLQWCFTRIKELNDEIYSIKSGITDAQLELTRIESVDKQQLKLNL